MYIRLRYRWLTLFLSVFLGMMLVATRGVRAQISTEDGEGYFLPAYVVDGDTIPVIRIPAVVCVRERVFKREKDYRAYQRMVRNLKIVYPYAAEAERLMRLMDSTYLTMDSEYQKRRFAQKMERELMRQFESQVRNLTVSQGKMLLKLIDRQTGRTSYEIIRTFRGRVSAGFWQGVAKVFGEDLKSKFKRDEEDQILDELIVLYEAGQL